MLNSREHEISLLIKSEELKNIICFAFKVLDAVFILLINVKMTTIVGILTFMSRIFMFIQKLCQNTQPKDFFIFFQNSKFRTPWRNDRVRSCQ